jgi:outer membrane protein TolC
MLKITMHDGPEAITFQVEGKLVGAWAKELEESWKTASSIRDRKALIVDLTETLYIDDEGKRVLGRLFRDGAFFKTAGAMTSSVVDEITGKPPKPWRNVLTQSIVLLMVVSIVKGAADPPAAPPTIKLTLREAVQLALKQNPQVQIANLNIAEGQENQNIARSALLPQASLGISDTLRRGNLETAFGQRIPGFPGHIGPLYVIQAGPNFSAPLLDLTAWKRWQASKETVQGTRAQEQSVREDTAQLVVSQYLGSLRAAADVTAAQSRADLAKALFDQAGDLQKNGVGTGIDTLRSNVQFQNEKQRLINAQTQLKTSVYALARLLNIDPHQNVELSDRSEFFNTPEYSADDTLERAYAERPEMKALASQVRSQQLLKQGARDQRLPRLSLAGSWSQEGITPTSVIPAYNYEASVEIPLFTGGRIKAQTAIADIEVKKLARQEDEARNRIALEVKTAVEQLESAKSEVEVANLGVHLAQQEVTQARDRFQAGVANNIEVVTAQNELSRASDNQIAALYRYNQARADLAHATGQMESLYTK